MSSINHLSTLAIVALAATAFDVAPGRAEPRTLTVASERAVGPFHGKPYRELEARLEGIAPGGAYAVPITIAFPRVPADHNGVALLDVVNTVTIGDAAFVAGGRPLPLARIHMGDDFLFGQGNVYVGVVWDKDAVEALGTGTIASAADAYAILRDAAALARNPAALMPAGSDPPPPSGRVVAYGYSQTGGLLRDWYVEHLNTAAGAPTFDGALIAGAAGFCRDLDPVASSACPGPLEDGGKVIALSTEGDAEWNGFVERGETADYRAIEIAGVAHIPAAAADFRGLGLPDQNPVDIGPAVRGTLVNLQAWLRGTEPPASVAIELIDQEQRDLMGDPFRPARRDADGNAVGGLRLPHLPTLLADGRKAGAPLGRYDGLDWPNEKANIYFFIAGSFTPFPANRLRELYPDHAAYVARVKAAADDLVARRYILPEDGRAYVEAAERSGVGQP